MRALVRSISAFAFVLLACGGDPTVEDACENFCACGAPDGADRSQCISACVDAADREDISQACIECTAKASCEEIKGQGCAPTCD